MNEIDIEYLSILQFKIERISLVLLCSKMAQHDFKFMLLKTFHYL